MKKVKYFCPACLAELEWDFDWDDHPTFKCPKCGERCQDEQEIEATPLTKAAVAKLRKTFIKMVRWLWDNPDGHISIPFHNDVVHPLHLSRGPWICGEWAEDSEGEYASIDLMGGVDDLRYPDFPCFSWVTIRSSDCGDPAIVGAAFDELIAHLDMYGVFKGKLQSAPRVKRER